MMQDILGGQIPMMFINQDTALPHDKLEATRLPWRLTARCCHCERPLSVGVLQTNPAGWRAEAAG